jgi:hypothetical protein
MAWCGAITPLWAQSAPPSDLFSAMRDGDARYAQRLTPGGPASSFERFTRSRFGEIASFGNPPASGASGTGFDSTNALRRKSRARESLAAQRKRPGRATVAPAPARPPLGANVPATTAMPLRFVRRGAPDLQTTSILNVPTTVATLRRLPVVLDNPFAPVGVRAGSFLLRPAIEILGGRDSNPTRINSLPGSSVLIVAPELQVRSDWQRHALNADLRGSYTWYGQHYDTLIEDCACVGGVSYLSTPETIDRPSVNSRVNGRIDVSSLSYAEIEGRYVVTTDNPGSPNIQAGLRRFPWVTTVGGSLGFSQRFNRFDVIAKGSVDKVSYESSIFTDGTQFSNNDREYNQYTGALRGSYDLKPGLRPFVEVGGYTRVHQLEFDRYGLQRDSEARFFKVGSSFEFTRKLTGELGVGYIRTEYKDITLPVLSGTTLDGSLIFSATPLTTLTLQAISATNEVVVPGVAGVFSRDLIATADHAFRRWLIATAKFGIGLDQYVGWDRIDHRYFVSLALIYKLSREVHLKGEIRRDWLRSNVPDIDWSANLFLVGVRLQR